jgi:hypothetical protein
MNFRTPAFTLLLLAALAAPAGAQSRVLAMGTPIEDTTRSTMSGPSADPSVVRLVLPAIVARAELGSYQVVEVPVPAEVPLAVPSRWVIDALGEAAVLSRRSGTVSGDSLSPGRRTSLLVTFAVPRRARAGLLPVATVRFLGTDGTSVEVPIHLMVAQSRDVEITVAQALRGVRPGDRFTLRFRLTNLGNTAEQVEVRTELPPSWRASIDGERTITLGTHAMKEHTAAITVPLGAATGESIVRLIALVGGVPVATAESRVTVQRDTRAVTDGPLATITTAFGHDADGTTTSGVALELSGKVTDNISVSGSVSRTAGSGHGGSHALARTGLYHTRPSLRFAAPSWSLGLGITGETFTDLTGTGLGGEGVSGSLRVGRLRASALFGRPVTGPSQESGVLAGGTVALHAGALIVSGTATHLREQRGETRELDAVSLGAQLPAFMQGALAAEVAQRWTALGASPGAALNYDRQTAGSALTLRAVHAPGGSRAFARATNEVTASASRSLPARMSVFGSLWLSEDRGSSALGHLRSRSGSLGLSRRIGSHVSASASVQHNSFSTSGSTSGFSNAQTEGAMALGFARNGLRARAAVQFGEGSRSTRFTEVGAVEESGTRRGLDASIGWSGGRGTLELSGRMEQNEIGSGTIPRQVELLLRATDIPVVTVGRSRLVIGAEVRRSDFPGFAPVRWTTGVSADAQLPFGFSIGATAERNPYLQTAQGSGGWLYGVRLGRAIGLPRVSTSTSRGMVFEDRNGNGTRDGDEQGIANVVVRHREGTAATDATGRYQFATLAIGNVEVDPASLPIGWLVTPESPVSSAGDIAVVQVAPVSVELAIAVDSTGRGGRIDLSKAVVMARHTTGRIWVARQVQPGVAVFDALPPGEYQVVLDLIDLPEAVEARGKLPTFLVGGVMEREPVRVTLHPRKLNIKQIGGTTTPASATVAP